MFVNDAVLALGKQPEALFAFFHTQRTGGSNLQRWMLGRFRNEEVYSARTGSGYTQWQKLPDLSIYNQYRLVAGFAEYREFETDRPFVGLANIRHPFYRNVSLYKMSRAAESHWLHDVAMNHDFEDFYRIGSKQKPYYFHDLSSRRLGGGEGSGADAAIENMQRHFGLVAPTNNLHEATKVLIDRLGWQIEPIAPNGAPPDPINYADYDELPIRDEIISKNLEDLRLYEYVIGQNAADEAGSAPNLSSRPNSR